MLHSPHWLATADGRHARLYRVSQLPSGRTHVEWVSRSDFVDPDHEHGRPTMLGVRGPNPGEVAPGHEREENLHRFTRQLASWLESEIEQHSIELLYLFLEPRMLGQWRRLSPTLPVVLRDGGLVHLSLAELQERIVSGVLLPPAA